ncbi:MAG: peptidase T [Oligoflexia bacterium]|nr:peptidase T [Oligoflexia bacterium]
MTTDKSYLEEIFLKSVRINTASVYGSQSLPSSKGQLELGKMLAGELRGLGVKDVVQDSNGYVIARIPGNTGAPAIAFLSHLDTVGLIGAETVEPVVHRDYDGDDIRLPYDGTVISVKEHPALKDKTGKTIITSDGRTILGGDDKSGVAIQMELARILTSDPEITHGDVVLVFTPDEEIGCQCRELDVKQLGARCAYTIDGDGLGMITDECFCADMMTLLFKGRDIHTCCAKNIMVNSIRVASEFIDSLPKKSRPEKTEKRQGFIHVLNVKGTVSQTEVTCLIRDFSEDKLLAFEEIVKKTAQNALKRYQGAEVEIQVKQQYRNMKPLIEKDPPVIDLVKKSFTECGVIPRMHALRGGTDGANISYMGLPCPNLSAGYYAEHSKSEWACLEDMEDAVKVVLKLVQNWARIKV